MGENSNYKRPLNRLNAVILLEKLVRNLWMLHTNGIKWNQIEPEQKCQTEVITVPMELAKCVLAFPFRLYLLIRKNTQNNTLVPYANCWELFCSASTIFMRITSGNFVPPVSIQKSRNIRRKCYPRPQRLILIVFIWSVKTKRFLNIELCRTFHECIRLRYVPFRPWTVYKFV